MALQVLPKPSAASASPAVKALLEHWEQEQEALGLDDAIVFYNFPLFREDDELLVADLVLISPLHGVLLVSPTDQPSAEHKLEGAFNHIFSRLVRYPRLRSGRARLAFALDATLWAQEGPKRDGLAVGFAGIDGALEGQRSTNRLDDDTFAELVSVLDGSKALIKPRERNTEAYEPTSRVHIIRNLEEEIRKFDRDQRVAYMTEVHGTQRIRGLAGSGKTVVLAMKAALTAIREPNAMIAVTFYTKSLYQHIKRLITRFYRLHEDKDPDWTKLRVLHAWGGATADGFYYVAATRLGHQPMTYGQASNASSRPFAHVCEKLLADPALGKVFDYVFVDEAQDFPPEFMRLALRLADEEKLVIAYDAFQTIFDVETPTAASLFGLDSESEPDVNFDEDIILHKCYRNPREILMCAHAIGFGIYGPKIVQMLESKEHWNDFGYDVVSGELNAGETVKITRSTENSPSSISTSCTIDQIITVNSFASVTQEVAHVAARIKYEIDTEGVPAEDILVVCADDRSAGQYLALLKRDLQALAISSNNLQDDQYSIRDFQREGAVTLSTIYKAKGNEAYVVFVMGMDALFYNPSAKNRNKAFTAMTRAKAWLHITGSASSISSFESEIRAAKSSFPYLSFVYPNMEQLAFMKRDLVQADPAEIVDAVSRLAAEMEPEELEYFLRKQLRDVQKRRRPKKRIA